jgi:hypothetical protein
MIAVVADMLGTDAEAAVAVCILSSAPRAMPVFNIMNKPNPAPTRGINIPRQSTKLFMKIDGINVPLAVFVVTV